MKSCFNKKLLAVSLIAIAGGFFCSAQESEAVGVDRYALFVGSNMGGQNTQRLYYAESDAIAFLKTMKEIGGIPQSNAVLLLDPTKDDLNDAMDSVSELIRRNSRRSKRSEFLFYYSGHSDENALQLGNANYSFSELKAAITSVPSDVHVVILDSCYSGNFIRTKGGQKTKPFLLDDSTIVKGHAYLSSSSSQEYSQESDEIGSSFFTNAMLTGLRGAADSSGDKKVTLNELYSYAFNETLSKTENSAVGPQHPNYNITLVGSGDLVLSDISNSDSVVMLAEGLKGRVIIRDKNGKLVSEINKNSGKPVFLALEKGDYSATIIKDTVTLQGSFPVTSGRVYEISEKSFNAVATSAHRLRGGEGSEDAEKAEVPEEDRVDSGTLTEDTMYVPFEVSFLMNEITRNFHKKIETSFALSILHSNIYKVNGAMVSLGYNEAEIVNGAQVALAVNVAQDLHGVQVAYGTNFAHDFTGAQVVIGGNRGKNFKGAQAALILNRSNDFQGIQAAGIGNIAENYKGIQAAGICNGSDDFKGIQAAGIYNGSKNVLGIQASGIANKADNVTGLQAAGVVNVAKDVNGVQVGLVNVAKDVSGVQIGLVNICNDGIIEIASSFTSNRNFRVVMNSGNRHLYGIMGGIISGNILFENYDGETSFNFIYGLGTRYEKGIFNLDVEAFRIVDNDSSDEDESYGVDFCKAFIPSIRLEAGIKPVKHFNIFAGVSATCDYGESNRVYNKLERNIVIHFSDDFRILPEFDVGVKYCIK